MAADYYDLLGVSRTASADEIKKAFRAKAHQFHPDKATGDAEKFKQINEAYQVLSNPEQRQQYDQFGQTHDQARRQGGGPAGGFGGFPGGGFNGNVDFGDLGDMFGDIFGFGGGRSTRQPERGRDVQATLKIPFLVSVFGGEESVTLKRLTSCDRCEGSGAEPGSKTSTCPTCQGSGQVQQVQRTILGAMQTVQVCPTCQGSGQKIETRCDQCHGEGRLEKSETLSVKIPGGISDGQKIRLTGKGEAGRRKTPSGDLFIIIRIERDPRFERDGDDLVTRATIRISTAVLGGTVDIPTVDGTATMKIPAGTASGREFILRGKGVTHLRGHGRGDLRVIINIEIPSKISGRAKKILKDLGAEGL